MLPSTYSDSQSATALSIPREQTTAADPWDAPYFGAPIYFQYQPSLPARAHTEDHASRLPVDPWDAPYFGGTVYLGYSAYPATLAAPPASLAPSTGPADEQSLPVSAAIGKAPISTVQPDGTATSTRRRNWLARLFGRP